VKSLIFTEDGALRVPWRLGLFVAALVFTGSLFSLLDPVIRRATSWMAADPRIVTIGELMAMLSATWLVLRWIERRGWDHVAMGRDAWRPRALAFGGVLGGLAILVPCLALLALGWLAIVPAASNPWFSAAAALTLALLVAALTEELLVRGYLFASLREGVGDLPALAITSAIFGALHSWNPGASVQSIAMVTLAGFFLGAVLLVTGSLYAAWLAHASWNWVLAVLLQAPVSGIETAVARYRTVDRGPEWATGGAWGPEGGLFAALSMGAATVYLVGRLTRRQERTEWTTASR
jgi:uncharacterized protein